MNTLGATTCTDCGIGKYMQYVGARVCTSCEPGRFQSLTGSIKCSNCTNGTYFGGRGAAQCKLASYGFHVPSDGSANQTACPAGTYMNQTGWGRADCHLCERGKSTFNLDGRQSCVWCSVANTYRDGVSKKADGRVLKVKKRRDKEDSKLRFVAYEQFYQNEEGQPECKECRSNRQKGAGFCTNDGTDKEGAIICLGFFQEEEDCKKQQKIKQSISLAYVFFAFLVLLGIPFMFLSGGLGAISHVWRKDAALLIKIMREGTERGLFLMENRMLAYNRRIREAGIRSTFFQYADIDDSANICDLKPSLQQIGIETTFIDELERIAFSVKNRGNRNDEEGQNPVRINFAQFRSLLSVLAHRLAFARQHELYRSVFRSFDEDGGGTLDEEEMKNLAATLGRKFTRTELNVLKGAVDGKEITPTEFVRAMHSIDAREKKSRILQQHELKEARYEKAFDQYKTETHGKKTDFLDQIGFRLAVSSLGLIWSMELLELVRDVSPQISKFTSIQALRKRKIAPIWAKARLRELESGWWSFCVVIITTAQITIEDELIPGSRNQSFVLDAMNICIMVTFLVELIQRIYIHRKLSRWFTLNFLNIVDVSAVAVDLFFLLLYTLQVLQRFTALGTSLGPTIRFMAHLGRSHRSGVRAVRFARLFRSARIFLSIFTNLKTYFDKSMHIEITYTEFRRFLSARVLHDSTEWPYHRWRSAFALFDAEEHGFVSIRSLDQGLLDAAGVYLSPEESKKFNVLVDRQDGYLLFEDFVDAMQLFHDENIEDDILSVLDDPAVSLLRTLKVLGGQVALFFIIFLARFDIC